MFRKMLAGMIAIVVASTIALIIAEVLVRALGLASPSVAVSADERTYATIPGVFFPSATRVNRQNPRLPHRVTINELGYRGAPIERDKGEGERRILFIGDSFTWGDLVHDDETLPFRLEQRLQRSCPGLRVLNLGVGGTTIDAQREMLERAIPLAPDLVILMFHDNDVTDLRPPTYWTQVAENRAAKSRFPSSVAYRLLRHTALWTVARQSYQRLRTGSAPAVAPVAATDSASGTLPPIVLTPDQLAELEVLRPRYLAGLRAFAERVRTIGVPLVVTAYPSHHAVSGRAGTMHEWFADTAPALVPLYVDALGALQSSGKPVNELYLLPVDGHASAVGYAIVAEALATAILTSEEGRSVCEPRSVEDAPIS